MSGLSSTKSGELESNLTAPARSKFVPRLMIADDDPAIAQFITAGCEKIGFKVETAENGIETLIKAWKTWPDVLIVDVNMPGPDGISAAARILKTYPRPLEVIVITGRPDAKAEIRCDGLGFHYCSKIGGFWKNIEAILTEIFHNMAARRKLSSLSGDMLARQPRVLVVDDDLTVGTFLIDRFVKFGVVAFYASDANRAFRVACENCPSAIIADYHMPAGNAQHLLARLRSNSKTQDIPVFVMSGRQIDEATEKQLKQESFGRPGVTKILKKPFNIGELVDAIAKMCEHEIVDA